MTLYQAKGLEFPIVFVPQLLDGEWPTREGWSGFFPRSCCARPCPTGDIHTEEERRLLYVAMTRAQERLDPDHARRAGRDEGAVAVRRRDPRRRAATSLRSIDRTATAARAGRRRRLTARATTMALDAVGRRCVRRVMPLPTARERRLALRLRASELVGLHGGDRRRPTPRPRPPASAFEAELADVGRAAAMGADEARAAGPRSADLPDDRRSTRAPARTCSRSRRCPAAFSYSSFSDVRALPAPVRVPVRLPDARRRDEPVAGVRASGRRPTRRSRRSPRSAASAPRAASRRRPARTSSASSARAGCRPAFGDQTTEEGYQRRVATLLDNFWDGRGRSARRGAPRGARLRADARARRRRAARRHHAARSTASTACRRAASRSSTTRPAALASQKGVDESLQLSIYALACRDALGLGTPERVTLYFTESATRMSTTRTDEQLDAARDDILARVAGSAPATSRPPRQPSVPVLRLRAAVPKPELGALR